jgi:2-keto-4-pentenoate hydratase
MSTDDDGVACALARGMATQLDAWRAARAAGMPRAGWKVGLNFPEAQARLGLSAPTVGWLHGGRVLTSGAVHSPADAARRFVEAEFCLRLGRSVVPGVSTAEARDAIAGVAPALEIVDYGRSWASLEAIVSHSMFHDATVRGSEVTPAHLPQLGAALPRVLVDGQVVAVAREGLVPRELAAVIVIVANFLARYGESLEAGDLVLSGSYTNPVPAPAGARIVAEFGSWGEVSVRMAAPPTA